MFLSNYSELHGLLLPGRVPGYSRSDIKLLPSSVSKRGIWTTYCEAMRESSNRAVAYRTFCRRWMELLPSLVIMKPLSDLCWTCQKNSIAIQRATVSEVEKSAALQDYVGHLTTVTAERSEYTKVCKDCKDSVKAHYMNPPPLHSRIPPNSIPIKAHYSFDYAQQVCTLQVFVYST